MEQAFFSLADDLSKQAKRRSFTMSHKLLDSQKDALRWIVKKVRAGKLPEEEIVFSPTFKGLSTGHNVDPPDTMKEETIRALGDEGLLRVSRKGKDYLVSLTPDAYEAVDQM